MEGEPKPRRLDKEPTKYFVKLNKEQFDQERYQIEKIVDDMHVDPHELYAPCTPKLSQYIDGLMSVGLSTVPHGKIQFSRRMDIPGSPLIAELKKEFEKD